MMTRFLLGILSSTVLAACSAAASTPTSGSDAGQGTKDATPPLAADAGADADAFAPTSTEFVHLGFNAKGLLNAPEQIAFTEKAFASYFGSRGKDFTIRIFGGTVSQTTSPLEWTDEMLRSWVGLQKRTGLRFVFTVNGNDAPASQRALYDRFVADGASFDFVEMMNEYYLPKFYNGDTSKPEVTRQVRVEDYVGSILPTYLAAFKGAARPFVILAPSLPDSPAALRNQAWNDGVIGSLAKLAEGGAAPGVTLHLYRDSSPFDYGQVARVRSRLPAATPIAVTEAGIADETMFASPTFPTASADHLKSLLAELRPGDYLFDQVLYTNYAGWQPASLHPQFNGVTPKGAKIFELFREPPVAP